MGRGPRIEPLLYDTLRQKIQTLSSEAVRIHLGPEITPARMKNYLPCIARQQNVPVTARRVPGGLLFWRPTDNDVQQAKEVVCKLRTARRGRQARQGRRQRASRGAPITYGNGEGGDSIIHLSRIRTMHFTPV
jgi:hypothetical protein